MRISLGDIAGAWAQRNRTNNEFIIVEFEQVVYPERIDIYETFNSGAVVKVLARNGRIYVSKRNHFIVQFFINRKHKF